MLFFHCDLEDANNGEQEELIIYEMKWMIDRIKFLLQFAVFLEAVFVDIKL